MREVEAENRRLRELNRCHEQDLLHEQVLYGYTAYWFSYMLDNKYIASLILASYCLSQQKNYKFPAVSLPCLFYCIQQSPGEASSGEGSRTTWEHLRKTEFPWTCHKFRKQATEQLYRKFQGILNKLTPTKFQTLAEQTLQLDISTEERLSGCVDMIYTQVRMWPRPTGWRKGGGG